MKVNRDHDAGALQTYGRRPSFLARSQSLHLRPKRESSGENVQGDLSLEPSTPQYLAVCNHSNSVSGCEPAGAAASVLVEVRVFVGPLLTLYSGNTLTFWVQSRQLWGTVGVWRL